MAFLINSDSYLLRTGDKTSQIAAETLVTTRPKKQSDTKLSGIFDKMRMHARSPPTFGLTNLINRRD